MKMKNANNPNRECTSCGSTASSDKVRSYNEEKKFYYYNPKCKNCISMEKKKKLITICTKCKNEKDSNYQSYCKKCAANYQRMRKMDKSNKIQASILVEVKLFIEKKIESNFIADLMDINKIITYYGIISNGCVDLDHKKGGEQLQIMWNELYAFYNDTLKDFDTELLSRAILIRNTKCGKAKLVNSKSDAYHYINKICIECGIEKSGSDYYISGGKHWLRNTCKSCMIQRSKKSKKKKLIND